MRLLISIHFIKSGLQNVVWHYHGSRYGHESSQQE